MKKIIIALVSLLLLAGAAFIIKQNLPTKRYARHLVKARLFVKEKNFSAAQIEYEKAFNARGGYTPYANIEVLNFTNNANLQANKFTEAIANTKKFVEANPKNEEGQLSLSQLAFRIGDYETAFDAVNTALENDPKSFAARLLLTEVRTKQGRLDLAEDQLRIIYHAYPDSITALLPLAENMLRQGRVTEARAYIQNVLKTHPTNSSAYLMLLDSYLLENKADSGQMILDAWQKIDPSISLQVQIRKAQIQNIIGQFDAAETTLKPYLKEKEENLPAYFELALIKTKQGKYDSALKVFTTMQEIKPNEAARTMMLSVYLNFKNNNPAKALELLKSLQISIKNPEITGLIGVAYMALDQDAKLKAFIEEQPDSLRGSFRAFLAQIDPRKEFIGEWALAKFYNTVNQPQLAGQSIEALHKISPKNKMALQLWSTQLASMGKFADAAKALEGETDLTFPQQATLLSYYMKSGQKDKTETNTKKLLRAHPNQRGLNLFLADFYTSNGQKDKATPFYEKELSIEPENVVALNNLAWEYGINQKNLIKALPYVAKLRAKKMLDPRILDTIGWIFTENGKEKEAEDLFRTALNIVPDQPSFNYHMAVLQNKLGKNDLAKTYLATALASKMTYDERKDAEKLVIP